jgi:hypothetical protein
MKREEFFGDYESQNATFFFFERLEKKGDEFDKSAMMLSRSLSGSILDADCFNAIDEHVGVMSLGTAYGIRIFDILRAAYESSEKFPGSVMVRVLAGRATAEDLERAFRTLTRQKDIDQEMLLEAIVCNEAASWPLLDEMLRKAPSIERALTVRRRFRRRHRRFRTKSLQRILQAGISVHPNVPSDVRASLVRELKKRHVLTDSIRIDQGRDGSVRVAYQTRETPHGRTIRRRHRRYRRLVDMPMSELVRRQKMWERSAKRTKDAIRKKRTLLAKAAKTPKKRTRS